MAADDVGENQNGKSATLIDQTCRNQAHEPAKVMPGMDGLELCRRLKNSQPSVVVALITALSSIATSRAAAEAGVRCSLVKPVNFSVLMPLVEEAVGSG